MKFIAILVVVFQVLLLQVIACAFVPAAASTATGEIDTPYLVAFSESWVIQHTEGGSSLFIDIQDGGEVNAIECTNGYWTLNTTYNDGSDLSSVQDKQLSIIVDGVKYKRPDTYEEGKKLYEALAKGKNSLSMYSPTHGNSRSSKIGELKEHFELISYQDSNCYIKP